jgi:SAM-dependent methyltransferase
VTERRSDATTAGKTSASLGAHELDDPTQALVYDLTQPYVVDHGCFVEPVAGAIERSGAARIFDLGCGTGLQAMPLLERVKEVDYLGVDRSAAMVSLFQRKLDARPALAKRASLRSGLDLRMRRALEALPALGGGAVLMSQFLQYFPVAPGGDVVAKAEMLAQCVALAGPGGRVFVIEDVAGEDPAEHARLSAQWDSAVVARYAKGIDDLRASLGSIAPRHLDAIGTLLKRPSLMATMRERRRQTRGETILPLSAWRALVGGLGRSLQLVRHRELENFYLMEIEC